MRFSYLQYCNVLPPSPGIDHEHYQYVKRAAQDLTQDYQQDFGNTPFDHPGRFPQPVCSF